MPAKGGIGFADQLIINLYVILPLFTCKMVLVFSIFLFFPFSHLTMPFLV